MPTRSLLWDSEVSCCVAEAKSGSPSHVCPGYDPSTSGTVRVNKQRVKYVAHRVTMAVHRDGNS